jgi:hypothetical protein
MTSGRLSRSSWRGLRELEPLADEYRQLRAEADRLGLTNGDGGGADATAGTGTAAATGTDAGTTAAAAGGDQEPGASTSRGSSSRARRGRASSGATGGRTARRAGGSRGGNRQDDLLRLVAQSPGITVTQAGRELGVDPTGLYRPVRKLVADGKLDKQGAALHPAGR